MLRCWVVEEELFEHGESKAGDSCAGTPLWKERLPTKVTAWLVYGLKVAVLEKNMTPASKVSSALPEASVRTTPLRGGCCLVPLRLRLVLKDGSL